ncbi:MAG TPA: penicillin acylase family protein [Solirubrobacterales bacterium]|nr:penicillin acylase family protein [Solirubrobacterales bacterium]HMU26010.1 penicillin acylase family protein [Solirubrobacterales bacterium]HMX70806.1 penicillin acylase family protein [Solirubrobacterales bacterium]HMY26211.1 penicillin acylase family protein [Solirubrobacterales bacterium]HNA24382.1 penicillin acylase family protein [Solirubrobacterales bacterium]
MLRKSAYLALLLLSFLGLAVPVANAAPKDYSAIARNIIPSGQKGTPPLDTTQAVMYDALTPLFNNVTDSDIKEYFKSEKLGTSTDGPYTTETVPKAGVTIQRDKYGVPHVTATTYDGGIWAAGWIAAEDRGLLLQQARYNARVAAIDAPGLSAIGLVAGLQNFQPSQRTEDEIAKQTDALKAAGSEGKAVLKDIDTYLTGINDYLDANSPATPDWTRNDVYAVNALKDQFLGEGGGDEARRSQFLGGLIKRLGAKKGWKVFNDLRQHTNNESPTSIDGRFAYSPIPSNKSGSVIIDPKSFKPVDVTPNTPEELSDRSSSNPLEPRHQASNTLMITKGRSATGRPLMVGGPQIGYFAPGLTYEIDMNAPGLKWRGATSAPFPGYLLIGRGQDFATTLTSASGDVIDQFAETLCGGSDTKYLYKGKCRTMGTFDAGTLNGDPVSFRTTVHGPVVGYATVKGKKVAISSKRSSYGKDVLDLMFNRRLSNGSVKGPQSFFEAASKTPQTFNSFYIDNKNVALYTSGKLPIRDKRVDPGLLTKGTGQYEWKGFLSKKGHPHGMNPKSGMMVNWNNSVARGFGAADDEWGRNGSVQRVGLLTRMLNRNKSKNGKLNMADVVSAMNAGATQDVRAIFTVPLLAKLLKGSKAPSTQARQMLNQMVDWNKKNGSRLDRDGDNLIDAPGAASLDAAWPKIADAFMKPVIGSQLDELSSLFSRFDQPPSGQYSGWYQYFDKDIRALLGQKVKSPFKVKYCGHGKKAACQKAVWNAIAAAGTEAAAQYGSENPAQWHVNTAYVDDDHRGEQIKFSPLTLVTMRYTNRPSGIQQVISFNGHR